MIFRYGFKSPHKGEKPKNERSIKNMEKSSSKNFLNDTGRKSNITYGFL